MTKTRKPCPHPVPSTLLVHPFSPTRPSALCHANVTRSGTGEYIPAKATFDGTTVANCDGCKANFYQSAGTSATDGACTAW